MSNIELVNYVDSKDDSTLSTEELNHLEMGNILGELFGFCDRHLDSKNNHTNLVNYDSTRIVFNIPAIAAKFKTANKITAKLIYTATHELIHAIGEITNETTTHSLTMIALDQIIPLGNSVCSGRIFLKETSLYSELKKSVIEV